MQSEQQPPSSCLIYSVHNCKLRFVHSFWFWPYIYLFRFISHLSHADTNPLLNRWPFSATPSVSGPLFLSFFYPSLAHAWLHFLPVAHNNVILLWLGSDSSPYMTGIHLWPNLMSHHQGKPLQLQEPHNRTGTCFSSHANNSRPLNPCLNTQVNAEWFRSGLRMRNQAKGSAG